MKNDFPSMLVLCVSLAVASFGCSRKTDANTELEKAASALANAAPAAAPPPATTHPAPTPEAAPAPAQQMHQAIAAYKAGELKDAVTRLHKLRATPVMTPEQRMALNDAMAAVMTDLYALAAKGDARAIAAVKQYELMQTTRQ